MPSMIASNYDSVQVDCKMEVKDENRTEGKLWWRSYKNKLTVLGENESHEVGLEINSQGRNRHHDCTVNSAVWPPPLAARCYQVLRLPVCSEPHATRDPRTPRFRSHTCSRLQGGIRDDGLAKCGRLPRRPPMETHIRLLMTGGKGFATCKLTDLFGKRSDRRAK